MYSAQGPPFKLVKTGSDLRKQERSNSQLRERARSPGGAAPRAGRGLERRAGLSDSPERRRERLVEVYHEASECTKCPLSETRTNVVFGAGNADAGLMFVGEAPAPRRIAKGSRSSGAPEGS